jgi:hypothetical protein
VVFSDDAVKIPANKVSYFCSLYRTFALSTAPALGYPVPHRFQ